MKQSSCHFVGKNRVLPLQLNCKLYKNVLIRLMLCLNLNAVKCAKRKGTHFRVPFSGADDGNRTHTISLEG